MTHHELLAQDDIFAIGREWLIECFPDDEEEILELTAAQTKRAINRYYDGGWQEFLSVNSD